MEITIFKAITTEGVIKSIEENSKKYHVGFYADMSNAPERKLVKGSSADIKHIEKELEAARIKINRENTTKTNNECAAIVKRLQAANAPFTVLEDEYKAMRTKILFDEKEVVRLRAAMVQKEDDHEMAILINKTFEFDRKQLLMLAHEEAEAIRVAAEAKAEDRQVIINANIERDRINSENSRLANVEHVRSVNVSILVSMIDHGLQEAESKDFIKTLAKKNLKQITINY